MLRGTVSLILGALALGGCATPPERPPEIGYLAPTEVPPRARSAVIEQDPELVLGNLVDRLQQSSFQVTHLDEQAGEVVVVYSGDPEPYVDCGWIIAYQTGGLERTPAATATARFDRAVQRDVLELDRELRLDGRMMVRIEQEGAETVVSPKTTYVLTKIVDAARRDGDVRGRTRETISFKTGESGRFSKGTQCQPNGQFERAVLDSLPATAVAGSRLQAPVIASEPLAPPEAPVLAGEAPDLRESPAAASSVPAPEVPAPEPPLAAGEAPELEPPLAAGEGPAVEPAAPVIDIADLEPRIIAITDALDCAGIEVERGPSNDVRLSGYVSSEDDLARLRQSLGEIAGLGAVELDLEVHPWPFCELLAVIAPYRNAGPSPELGLELMTADRNTQLARGDALTLDIFLPPDARYLYLGYVQNDGRVGYITMMPVREWAEGPGGIRFETGFEISEPFGREMIVAITSQRPLFEQPRPAYEPASAYVADLRSRLSELQASGPEGSLAAAHLFITTEPERAF